VSADASSFPSHPRGKPSSPPGNVIKVTRAQVMAARELADIASKKGERVDAAVAAIASVSLEPPTSSPRRRPPTTAPATAPNPTTG
jgi:hypothetical protein